MSESLRIDSPLRGLAMPKAYSGDLRERVIGAVETGASRREAAERFEVSVASAVKWLQRWRERRSAAPKPRGGSISPLGEFAVEVLALIAEQPDLTLVETVAKLRKRRIKTSRSSLPIAKKMLCHSGRQLPRVPRRLAGPTLECMRERADFLVTEKPGYS
jgi:transposase